MPLPSISATPSDRSASEHAGTPACHSRRQFIKLGTLTVSMPAAATLLSACAGSQKKADEAAPGPIVKNEKFIRGRWLDEDGVALFRATVPAVVPEIVPEVVDGTEAELSSAKYAVVAAAASGTALERELAVIDTAFVAFGPVTQNEFGSLISLLSFAPTRGAVAGVWSSWDSADPETIDDFLDDWRASSLTLLNAGYSGIVKIISTSYYGQPEHFAEAGYPGPPEFAVRALPQFQDELKGQQESAA